MSPTFPNVTDMSAILIIHGDCLSHLSPHALIEFEASNPPILVHSPPFNSVSPVTVELGQNEWKYVQVEIKKWAAG